MVYLVHDITEKKSMEDVIPKMMRRMIKGPHEWIGKRGGNVKATAQEQAKNKKVGTSVWLEQYSSDFLCT